METKEINIWKNKLLDLGKKNNMINFKDNASTTIDIVCPDIETAYKKITNDNNSISIFDDKNVYQDEEDDVYYDLFTDNSLLKNEFISKEDYIKKYSSKIKGNTFLLYKENTSYRKILRNLKRKATESISERGINVLYIAFGFIKWKETEDAKSYLKAPILLVPITIKNETIKSPYNIKLYDDEILLNPTFKYLLKSQYEIEIPEYDDQNISEYFDTLELFFSNSGWTIEREAKIGLFSFTKINIYFDLDKNTDKVNKNNNIKLLTGKSQNKELLLSEGENNKDLFINQYNVVDADYSQTEAIDYALNGKSFVLQGPPGTGKSQTITNIIAELLNANKKVLFVSEKMAALEVVYNNLKKVGLNEFCLELHSYKANKKDFINDLYNTLTQNKTTIDKSLINKCSNLNDLKDKLDKYNEDLNQIVFPIKKTPFEILEILNNLRNIPDVEYVIPSIKKIGERELNNSLLLLERFKGFETSIGYNYKENPLYGFVPNNNSYSFKIEFKKILDDSINIYDEILNVIDELNNKYNIPCDTINKMMEISQFIDICIDNNIDNNILFNKQKLSKLLDDVEILKNLSNEIKNKKRILLTSFNEDILLEDGSYLYDLYVKEYANPIKRLFNSGYKVINSKLKLMQKNINDKIKYFDFVNYLDCLSKYQELMKKYSDNLELKQYNLTYFNDLDTDWDKLKEILKQLLSFINKKDGFDLINLEYLNSNNISYSKNLILKINELNDKYLELNKKIAKNLNKEIISFNTNRIHKCYKLIKDIKDHFEEIDNWVLFLNLLKEIEEDNLINFIDKVISLKYPLKDIENYYKYCIYMQWMDFIFEKRPYLKEYTRNIHDQDINLFKEKDKIKFDLSKMYIKEKLTNLRPVLDMQTAGSPAKLIEREYDKKRKLKPIRTIMTEIPEFIQLIKPCFLMSPLSVSTYLPEFMEFDVVIFDEASQVFPEDAIGAIYRSKQLIVVGDSKQMPPSNFFSASDNSNDEFEEDETDIDAYESILDLCSGILPKKSLLYHYRSKDESLITFSNKNFYGFNLVTFPSTNIEKTNTGIDFEYLNDGVYDQKSRTNLKEALKIVELVYDHYRKYPERSLGVVAFNIAQQNLIIKLLSKRREYDPSLEEFFRDDRNEPFFVKNLETVQGDERDTIIFSITYGYDSKGQFALRFGPLNLVGGERRLNVAITRAKLNVKIVSSIKAQDIDVSRVTNSGPKLLRDYLDYCQNGVIESHKEENIVINESSFISDICDFLKEKGFETDINVGYSKFKVDIALKDLETNNYVLAIQCDGSSYQRFNSARDRDRLHQSVLEGMNWNFYRIWSTDWFSNNKRESKMLIEACHNALKKKGE